MAVQMRTRTRYTFDRYLNARSASLPSFSPNGRFVTFVSDITGVPQLWQVPVEGGWPEQLTFTADRVMSGRYAHEKPTILFGMDAGGNEREQFFTLDHGDVRDLAVDPSVMHMSAVTSWDDTRVAYSDNRRHPAFFDIYIRDMDGGNEELVYQQDGSNFVTDWSRDGRYLLIYRMTGSRDSELFLLDLHSGEATHLTPHEGPVIYGSAQFAPDASSVYLTTDLGSEFVRAARMDLRSHEISFLSPDDHDVESVTLSPDGRNLALIRNLDGYCELGGSSRGWNRGAYGAGHIGGCCGAARLVSRRQSPRFHLHRSRRQPQHLDLEPRHR